MNEFVYSVLNQNEISIRIVSAEMPWQLMVAVNFSDVRELITSNCTFAPLCRKEGDTVVCIRGFRQSVVDNSHHRYFVDSRRVICIQYLYRTFVSRVATLLRQTSADLIELQTPAFTAGAGRSIREGISGRYPVILPFELSVVAYPLRNKPDVFSIAWP